MVQPRADLAKEPIVRNWAIAGCPLVARSRGCADAADQIALGLPLPPEMGKRRIALQCAASALRDIAPPPTLRDAAASAPLTWQVAIIALLIANEEIRCFGGLAWQHLTKLEYLSDSSDLDLLCRVDSAARADAMAAIIGRIAAGAPMKIDAELTTPAGLAVHWREWAAGADEILVKSLEGAQLVPRATLFQ